MSPEMSESTDRLERKLVGTNQPDETEHGRQTTPTKHTHTLHAHAVYDRRRPSEGMRVRPDTRSGPRDWGRHRLAAALAT